MPRDYLFRKNGSSNWSVRFQRDGKDTIKSLGTSNRQEAEIIAGPADHASQGRPIGPKAPLRSGMAVRVRAK